MTHLLRRFVTDQRGATAIEYALIAGIVSISIVAGLIGIRDALEGMFSDTASKF